MNRISLECQKKPIHKGVGSVSLSLYLKRKRNTEWACSFCVWRFRCKESCLQKFLYSIRNKRQWPSQSPFDNNDIDHTSSGRFLLCLKTIFKAHCFFNVQLIMARDYLCFLPFDVWKSHRVLELYHAFC